MWTSQITKPAPIKLPLADRILLRIKALTPTQFEHFAPSLIKAIYDDKDEFVTTHNGKVGDGGIDAVLKVKKKIGSGYDKYLIHGDNLVQKIIEHKLGIKEIPQQPIFEIDEGFFGLFADK